jgi:hypothetical protein
MASVNNTCGLILYPFLTAQRIKEWTACLTYCVQSSELDRATYLQSVGPVLIIHHLPTMATYAIKSILVFAAAAALVSAQTYKATITEYGSGDINDSGNCNVKTYVCFLPSCLPNTNTLSFPRTRIGLRADSTQTPASVRQCPRIYTASVQARVLDLLVAGAGESLVKR